MRHGLVDGITSHIEEVGKEFGVTENVFDKSRQSSRKIRQHPSIARLRTTIK